MVLVISLITICFCTGFNGDCSVIFINDKIVVDGNDVELSFAPVGGPDVIQCRLDREVNGAFANGEFADCKFYHSHLLIVMSFPVKIKISPYNWNR